MPMCVMATKTHPGGASPDCPFRDIVRDIVMASKELDMPVTAAHSPKELYVMIHTVADTMGVHGWLHGHYMFMSIYEELFQPDKSFR